MKNMESPNIHYNTIGTEKNPAVFGIVVTFSTTKAVDHDKTVQHTIVTKHSKYQASRKKKVKWLYCISAIVFFFFPEINMQNSKVVSIIYYCPHQWFNGQRRSRVRASIWSNQRLYNWYMCCFSTKHTSLRRKSKDSESG